jgi:hypothetical protein
MRKLGVPLTGDFMDPFGIISTLIDAADRGGERASLEVGPKLDDLAVANVFRWPTAAFATGVSRGDRI